LAENTRILKIFLKDEENDEDKVYPFIIDKIVDKRDSHYAIYRDITCSGLAFSELGKVGYKLELTSETFEIELNKLIDSNPNEAANLLPTLDYWLDKVFPNKKDANGKIIKWLTPWCYEVRMDWSYYSTANNLPNTTGRLPNKMYDDSYVTSWKLQQTV
jgi:hypothetical protein